MATIGTTTANTPSFTNAWGWPPQSMMDLNVATGELWMLFKDQSNRCAIYKSSDKGGSWAFQTNFTVSGYTIEDVCEMRIDSFGEQMHMVLMVNGGFGEELHYKRVDISTGAVVGTTGTVRFSGPAGTNLSLIYAGACCPVRNPDGSYHVLVASVQHNSTSSGVRVSAITIKNDAVRTTFLNEAIIGPTREWRTSGDDTAITCSIDLEHNGDGITSTTPNIWITWLMNTTLYAVRFTWKGYKTGWAMPTKPAVVASGRIAERDAIGRWDGVRFVIASVNPSNQAQMQLIERNSANSGTTATRTSPSIGLGNITGARMMSYNHVTQDVRIFAVVGANPIYYIDYFRGSNTWGSWTNSGLTTPVVSEWGVRRGTYGTNQYDLYLLTGAGSPWTVSNAIETVNFAPTAPTWITGTAGTVSQNGAAFDVAQNLTLDWDFHDPNSTDTQSVYALQRQIGVAAAQWWRTSDNTWQSIETWNATASTGVTLTPAQWVGAGGATDPAHTYKVSTGDSFAVTSPYSSGLQLVPSARVDPVLTAPTANAILNTGWITVTWTNTEQGQWRVRVQPAIVADSFTRGTSNGWGNADSGPAWTITGATPNSDYLTTSGQGRHSHPSSNVVKETTLSGVLADDINILAQSLNPQSAATGGVAEIGIRARYIDANNYVHMRVFFNISSAAPSVILANVAAGVETANSGTITPNASIATAGPVNVRFVAQGGTLYGRMWATSSPEPTEWHVTCPATTLAAGPIAVRTTTAAANSNTKPYTIGLGDLVVSDATLASFDSGWTADPLPLTPATLSYTPYTVFPDGFQGIVTLQTKNAEGLASQVQTAPFSIDYVEPPPPTVTLSNTPASGGLTVNLTQAVASGAQPFTDRIELWRRKVASAATVNPANSNPFFETNANDWTNSGYSTVARSTVQFHEGAASLLLTPNGSTATPKVQTTALYPVTPGLRYELRGWVRSTTTNKTIRVYLDFYDNTPTLLSSAVRDFTPVATTWIYLWVRGTAPVGSTQVRLAYGQLATPAAGDTMYVDEAQLLLANDDNGIRLHTDILSGQTFIDWRAVTGVDYEYQGYAIATNGTSCYGPWVD